MLPWYSLFMRVAGGGQHECLAESGDPARVSQHGTSMVLWPGSVTRLSVHMTHQRATAPSLVHSASSVLGLNEFESEGARAHPPSTPAVHTLSFTSFHSHPPVSPLHSRRRRAPRGVRRRVAAAAADAAAAHLLRA